MQGCWRAKQPDDGTRGACLCSSNEGSTAQWIWPWGLLRGVTGEQYNCNVSKSDIKVCLNSVLYLQVIFPSPYRMKVLLGLIPSLLFTPTLSLDRPYISNGGWRTYPSDIIATPGPCNIDIRDNTMTQQEFINEYAFTKPVIVRDSNNNDLFRALARK